MSQNDALKYARKQVTDHGHATLEGVRGIRTDVPIRSSVRSPLPPFRIKSKVMVKRLNAELWGGYKILDTNIPFVFQNVAALPAFGTPGRIIWFGSTAYIDTGSGWQALALETAIDWSNILSKPSTFPPSAHHASHETGGSDALTALAASIITSGQLALARGGSHADLSGTGGSGQFLKQLSSGGDVTVAAILDAEVPSTLTNKTLGSGTAFGANPNFSENQALAFRVENVAGLPAAGNKGRLALLTTDNKVYYDNGTIWVAS